MIKQSTVNAILPLVEKLTTAKVSLYPVQSSTLDQLCATLYTQKLDVNNPLKVNGAWVTADNISASEVAHELMSVSTNKDISGEATHDSTMAAFVEAAAKAIRGTHVLASTVVNPMIERVVKSVEHYVANRQQLNVTPLSILKDDLQHVWTSPAFNDLISRYKDFAVENRKINRWLPAIDGDELIVRLKTGSRAFDREFEAYLNEIGKDTVKTVYYEFFQKREDIGNLDIVVNFIDYIHPQQDRNKVLITFLLARTLQDNIPDGITDVDLSVYKEYFSSVGAQAGRVLNRIFERRESDLRRNVVVLDYPSVPHEYANNENGIIRVNGKVYDEFLEKGGMPEVIFGAYVSGEYHTGGRTSDDLIAKIPYYTGIWDRHYNLLVAQQQVESFTQIVLGIKQAVSKEIVDLSEEYQVLESKAAYQERLNETIKCLNEKSIQDLYYSVRKVLTNTLFAHTDVCDFLEKLDTVADGNPKLTVNEAAAIATYEMVAIWLTKHFTVVTH